MWWDGERVTKEEMGGQREVEGERQWVDSVAQPTFVGPQGTTQRGFLPMALKGLGHLQAAPRACPRSPAGAHLISSEPLQAPVGPVPLRLWGPFTRGWMRHRAQRLALGDVIPLSGPHIGSGGVGAHPVIALGGVCHMYARRQDHAPQEQPPPQTPQVEGRTSPPRAHHRHKGGGST